VNGGPVDERRRREPRAHRFQAAESTSVVEQPSSFAGWRSVGSLGCCGSKVAERFVSRTTDKPNRHFSSVSDPTAMTGGARREKRRGLHHVVCRRHRARLGSSTEGTRLKTQLRECDLQPLLVSSARTSFSPPQEGGLGLRTDQRRAARFFRTAGASLRRERNSYEDPSNEREDRPLSGVPVCRCKKCCCRSRRAVRGSSGLDPLSGTMTTEPNVSLHRFFRTNPQGIGSKETMRVKGETARSRGAQAHRKM